MNLLTVILGTFLQLIPQPVSVEAMPGSCHPDDAKVTKEISYASDIPDSEEGYVLTIIPGHIKMRARSEAGFFYAEQTLAAIRRQFPGRVPAMKIIDHPGFSHRGIRIGVSGHLPDKEMLKKQLGYFASLKFNRLHLYFADGVVRYSRKEISEIQALADSLHITVIPELGIKGYKRKYFRSDGDISSQAGYPRILELAEFAWSPAGSQESSELRERALIICKEQTEAGSGSADLGLDNFELIIN